MPRSRGSGAARALCILIALSAVMQAAAVLFADPPREAGAPNSPRDVLGLESGSLAAGADVSAGDGLAAIEAPAPRVRDGLLEEDPSAPVSVLIRLRGEPISSVILQSRADYGPQDSWSPSAAESARRAVDWRNAQLQGQRDGLLGRLEAAGFSASPARDYRYLVNGLNLRNVPAAVVPVLLSDPNVIHIERDRLLHVELSQSVPLINADDVWNLTDSGGRNITGLGAVIANIDTGVDYSHNDLGGTLNRTNDLANLTGGTHTKFLPGWDFSNNDNDPWDDHLHGTHVAGIIGANGSLKGVAPGSKQIPLKVLDASGYGPDSDIIAAMEFAADPDRDAITDDAADASSMSLGDWVAYPDALSPLAADASTHLGTLCVIAAGNSGPDLSTVGSPGVSRNSITVGSTTKADVMSGFSSRGPTLYFDLKPDLVAPGSSIVSAAHGGAGGNRTLSGTSMATPHVSGVVALLRQSHPSWGVDEVKSALVDTAKDLGYGVFVQGGGRVDALAAENASVAAYPHKLAMGRLSRSAAQTNATLEFKNLGNASVALNLAALDLYGLFPNMTAVGNNTDKDFVTVSPTSLVLAPGERKSVIVSFAPSGSAAAGHYWGHVNASFPGTLISVPFAYYVRGTVALVDDDISDRTLSTAPFDNFATFPDSSRNISRALERLNVTHDIITVAHYDDNGPDLLELLNYPVVIWNVGYDYGYADSFHTHYTVSARDRASLSAYLDKGGQLWLLGESIAWDLFAGVNTSVPASHFLNAYLGVSRVDHELNTPNPVNGSSGTLMEGASYPTSPDWTLWPNNGDFATNLTPSARGVTILNGSTDDIWGTSYPNASVAVAVNNSTYRSVFWGFEFSWLTTSARFDDAVNRTLGFFNVTKTLSLPANELSVEVNVDPLYSDWLPLFEADWGRPFDQLARYREPLNATVVVQNLGSAGQRDVFVNVTLRDNTTAALQTVQLRFNDVPALSRVTNSTALTPRVHGYLTVNASFNRTDADASNNAHGRALLVPNWQEEVGSAAGWTLNGDWRTSTAWSYTASKSFRAGVLNNANDTLVSPLINLSLVNASSIAGGARLYFEMSGVISGSDAAYFETRNASNATWVTQRNLTSFSAPSWWNYFLNGVSLSNIAGDTGYFRVRLQTGGSSSSYLYVDHFVIWTNHERAAGFDPAITVTNATRSEGQLLEFIGSHSNPNGASSFNYSWSFGDNSSASTQNSTHTYANNGTYLVQFSVGDGISPNETAAMNLTVANVAPTVASATLPASANEAASVSVSGNCTDPGTMDIITYSWNFGDGTSNASGAAANHTYSDNGNYTVTLTCSDTDGGSSFTTQNLTVTNLAPSVSSMTATPNASNEGASVTFSGNCTDPAGGADPLTYTWNFGDGSSNATGASVIHTFADEGNYTVTLTCTDGDGGSASTALTQAVNNVAPAIVSAVGSPNPSDENASVAFSAVCADAGTLDSVSYEWDFGDGSALVAGSAPSHTYLDNGGYVVTLTCRDSDGGSNQTAIGQTVQNVVPVASIVGANATVEGTVLALGAAATDASPRDTLTFFWNFGDGGTSGTRNTTHAWRDNGAYLVSLIVTDDDGGTASAQLLVIVQNAPPSANFTVNGTLAEGAVNLFASQVTDPGLNDSFSYIWEFGDGTVASTSAATHVFADDGTYNVSLTVTDDDGASVRVSRFVVVFNLNPTASLDALDLSGIEGTNASFSVDGTDPGVEDALSFNLSFGDGSPILSGPLNASTILRHAFANEGNYTVSLTVRDGDGGSSTVSRVFAVLNAPPTLFVDASAYVAQEGSTISFTAHVADLGVFDAVGVTWRFSDDAVVLTGLNASHFSAQDGLVVVTVTAVDDGGGLTSINFTISFTNADPVVLDVLLQGAEAYEGTPANFTAQVVDRGVQDVLNVTWDWGDGSKSFGLSPRHTYGDEGNYTIVVTATDDGGATGTRSLLLRVLNVGPDAGAIGFNGTLQEGESVSLNATVRSVPGETLTFLWSFGDGGTASTPNATHIYRDSGSYTVRLTVSDGEGGTDVETRLVEIENVAPTLVCQVCPESGVQGKLMSVRAHATDPGRSDVITYRLVLPNGTGFSSADGAFDFALDTAGQATLELRADDGDGGVSSLTFRVLVLADFVRDGFEDDVDPDDDNDTNPDLTDPAPHDAAVGGPQVSTPTGGGLGLLLLLAVIAAAVALVVARLRMRRGQGD